MTTTKLIILGAWIGSIFGPALRAETERELKAAGGATIVRYVVEAPDGMAAAVENDPARQVGLILCFAEHDRPTGDEILPVREALLRLGLRDRYVLLAGHSQARKFGTADYEPIEKLIEWAKKTYPINPRRIYMYGKGEGGKISGEFAMTHPGVVTASITYSWGWWNMPSELTEAIDPMNSAPEFYMVLGLRDLSYHLTTVRDAYGRVSFKGYHVIYREFEDLGARTYHPPSNDDAIAWVTRLRNKNIPPSPAELEIVNGHATINQDGFFSGLALVGGVTAGEALQKLLESQNVNVRAAAVETAVHAIFSEPTIAAVAKKITDPSSKVRNAAFRALAINANWRSKTAQQALVEAAIHPANGVDPADRVAAVDAIVQAVRFQVKGARQDPQLFQALATLLDDKNEEVRVMAANTLAPIRDREFRGDLGRPELKAPEGGWQHWLSEVTATAAGYQKNYEVCNQGASQGAPVELFCKGRASLLATRPVEAFQYTLQAAEQGYVPAEAVLGMMYATGKGVQQNYAEATRWWVKAAEAGDVRAAQNASMSYRGVAGVPADPALSEKWAKYAAKHSSN